MAQDIAQKIINANSIKQGTIVVGVQPVGNYSSITTNNVVNPVDLSDNAILTNRFDDPSYYTA